MNKKLLIGICFLVVFLVGCSNCESTYHANINGEDIICRYSSDKECGVYLAFCDESTMEMQNSYSCVQNVKTVKICEND